MPAPTISCATHFRLLISSTRNRKQHVTPRHVTELLKIHLRVFILHSRCFEYEHASKFIAIAFALFLIQAQSLSSLFLE